MAVWPPLFNCLTGLVVSVSHRQFESVCIGEKKLCLNGVLHSDV